MPVLDGQAKRVQAQLDTALRVVGNLRTIEGLSRQYVAELIVVRVFALFEAIVEESACRLVCGASYCDGSMPALLRSHPTRSIALALEAMKRHGRLQPITELRWSKASEISKNLESLFPPNEHFVGILRGHGQFISDLRKVRNHIAHGNRGTSIRFQEVISNYYGSKIPGLPPGKMLLSSRFQPLLVEKFCRQAGVILRAALRA